MRRRFRRLSHLSYLVQIISRRVFHSFIQPWEMQSGDSPAQASQATRKDGLDGKAEKDQTSDPAAGPSQRPSLFTTPAPLRRLFKHFPLHTYSSNPLPIRASTTKRALKSANILYIFGRPNEPSPNPTCLRYQTLLVLAGIPFETAASNNHASPTGSLPYLVAAHDDATLTSKTIPASGLKSFIRSQDPHTDVALDASPAHLALLEPIRKAYLTALYLDDESFKRVCAPLYVDTASRSSVVRAALVPSLRAAAYDEVSSAGNEAPATDVIEQLKTWYTRGQAVDEAAVYEEAQEAFGALGVILGEARWFGKSSITGEGDEAPGWLDASVFAYTHAVLSLFGGGGSGAGTGMKKRQSLGAEKLCQAVARHENLVAHRDRILEAFR